MPTLDVRQHVGIHIGVLLRLRLGEDGEADVAQRLHPRPHDLGAAGGDVGEDGGLGLYRLAQRGGQLLRAVQHPPADRIKPWPVGGGGPPAEDGAQPHVHVGGIPDEQVVGRSGLSAGGVLVWNFNIVHYERFLHRNSVMVCSWRRPLPSNFVITCRSVRMGASSHGQPINSRLGSTLVSSEIQAA